MNGKHETHTSRWRITALLLGLASAAVPGPARAQDAVPPKPLPGPEATDVVQVMVEVRLPDGRPFAGAEVQVFSRYEASDIVRSRRQTGTDGRITAPVSLWPGSTVLTVYVLPTVDTAPLLEPVNEALGSGQRLERSLQVEPAAQVKGQVLDEQGLPVAGARISGWARDRSRVETYPMPEPDIYTTAGEDGVFLLGGLPAGAFTLDVQVEGRAAVRRAGGFLERGQRVEGVDLLVAPAHELTGQVLGDRGQAVAGASVRAGRPWRLQRAQESGIGGVWYYPSAVRHTRCDQDGLFSLSGVPDEERWNLEVKGPGHLPYQGRLQPGQAYVEVRMEPGSGLNGTVEDAAGEPVERASVWLRGAGRRKKESAADGSFHFDGLDPAGRYFVLVHKAGSAALTLGPFDFLSPPDALRVVLEPGCVLAGVALDTQGAPMTGVSVTVEPLLAPELRAALDQEQVAAAEIEFGLGRTATAADGAFRLADLGPGRYRVRAEGTDGQRAELELNLERDAEPLRLVLEPALIVPFSSDERRVAWFTAAYAIAAGVYSLLHGNYEFLFYVAVLLLLVPALAAVHRRVQLELSSLWCMSAWGLLHMAGGLLAMPEPTGVLYNLWLVPGRLKYDQVVHAFGFGVTTWVCWQALSRMLRRSQPGFGSLSLCVAAGMGFGALNEVVEFVATLVVAHTNVGGYVNTGWDLVSNLCGCLVAAVWIFARARCAPPS